MPNTLPLARQAIAMLQDGDTMNGWTDSHTAALAEIVREAGMRKLALPSVHGLLGTWTIRKLDGEGVGVRSPTGNSVAVYPESQGPRELPEVVLHELASALLAGAQAERDSGSLPLRATESAPA